MASIGAGAGAEFKRGWTVVLGAAIGFGFGVSAIPFYTIGNFSLALQDEFGWSRGQVQTSILWMMLGILSTAWIIGRGADRIGVRKVALLSQLGFAFGLMLLGAVQNALWMQYAAWFFMAALAAGTTPITWTRGLSAWFDKGRGLAFGIALMGSGVMAIIVPKVAQALIEGLGWRMAYVALGGLILLIAVPAVFMLFKERPPETGGINGGPPPEAVGLEVGAVLRGYRFWLMIVAFIGISYGVGGAIPNLVPMLKDKGLSIDTATSFASLLGLSVMLGRLIAGFLIDRFWAPGVAFVFLSLPALSCVILMQPAPGLMLLGVAVALIGLAAGAEFDLIAYLCSRYFGLKNYSQIYAWQFVAFSIASGAAPMIFGRVFDSAGSYNPALIAAALLFVAGGALLLALGRYPDFSKQP